MINIKVLIQRFFSSKAMDEYDSSCIENALRLQQRHEEFRQRIDQMKATLNGEQNWFLELRKENGHDKRLPV